MTYTALVFEDKDDGGFWAKVAELPGCYTSGESLEEIEENVKDAIATYLERFARRANQSRSPQSTS